MLKIRCSALGQIMTNARKKGELSKTCQSYIKQLVKEDLFNYKSEISTKPMDKGITMEKESIELYNEVYTKFYVKNETRLTNDFITGECDIDGKDVIIDIKSSWSLETFPAAPSDIDSKSYEWQLRGYMWLYGKPKAVLAYCMVSTPLDLLSDWDNSKIHIVDEIDPVLRVTVVKFERDELKEQEIKERVIECCDFYESYKQEILNK